MLVWIFPRRTNGWRFRRDLPDLRIWCMWQLHSPAVTRRRSSVAGMTRSHWGQVTWCNGRLHQIVAAMLVSGTGILQKSSHLNHTCYGKGLVRSVLRWKWMGSYTTLTIDRMPLLVARLCFMTMLKPNKSEPTSHCTPRARFIGNLSKSRVFAWAARYDSCKDLITFLELDSHFVSSTRLLRKVYCESKGVIIWSNWLEAAVGLSIKISFM